MAVRLMQFGAGRLVVTGSVVMRQSSRGRCSDESRPTRRRQRDGAARRRQACRTAVGRARRPRVLVPGYLFRLVIDTAGDPTITTTGYQTRAGDGRSVAHGGFPLPRPRGTGGDRALYQIVLGRPPALRPVAPGTGRRAVSAQMAYGKRRCR
jgi:hypothetical protein